MPARKPRFLWWDYLVVSSLITFPGSLIFGKCTHSKHTVLIHLGLSDCMIWSLGPSVSSLLTLLPGSVNRLRGGSSSRNLQMQIGLVWEPVIAKHRKARTRFKVLECGLSFAPIRFQKTCIVQVHPFSCIRNVILPFSKVQNFN